jgi:hypothetical protein
MIDSRSKFREGFIMLKRGFDFADLDEPLQKFTILWAYSERPVVKNVLTEYAKEEIDLIQNQSHPLAFWDNEQKEEYISRKIDSILSSSKAYSELYEGEIVQAYVNNVMCRFYPDEYTIVDSNKLFEIMQEEGYHTVCAPALEELAEFKKLTHYIMSRGVDKRTAMRWVSMGYKSFVMYKPYYELLEYFCRPLEIISNDPFYERIEGIDFTELNEIQREIHNTNSYERSSRFTEALHKK